MFRIRTSSMVPSSSPYWPLLLLLPVWHHRLVLTFCWPNWWKWRITSSAAYIERIKEKTRLFQGKDKRIKLFPRSHVSCLQAKNFDSNLGLAIQSNNYRQLDSPFKLWRPKWFNATGVLTSFGICLFNSGSAVIVWAWCTQKKYLPIANKQFCLTNKLCNMWSGTQLKTTHKRPIQLCTQRHFFSGSITLQRRQKPLLSMHFLFKSNTTELSSLQQSHPRP